VSVPPAKLDAPAIAGPRLGFAVKVLGEDGLPSHDMRRWQSGPHLSVSLDRLEQIFDYLESKAISMYRMSSALVPYATHPDLPQFHGQVDECAQRLDALGAKARALDLRLSFHPSQYIVLNSESESVREAAARDLELQASVLDALGLGPEAVVVLHVGSVGGDRRAGVERFLRALDSLSPRARARLAIENDDRCYSLGDVLEVSWATGLPVVWDVLHHHCLDPQGIPDREALELALATWPDGVTPKIHYSTPKTAVVERVRRKGRRKERSLVLPQLRAHADMVDPIAFEQFLRDTAAGLEFDIMLEAKAKDVALLRLREHLMSRGFIAGDGKVAAATPARQLAGWKTVT
jgi:UV DNA damage endonuclease